MQYLCIGALVGLLVEDKLLYSSYYAAYFFFVFTLLLLVSFLDRKTGLLKRVLLPCLLFTFASALFIVRGQFVQEVAQTSNELYQKQDLLLTIEERKEENKYTRYTASFLFGEKELHVYIRVDSYPKYELGEKVLISAALDKKESVVMREQGNTTFDYNTYLERINISGVYSFPKISRTGEVGTSTTLTLAKQRESFIKKIQNSVRSPESDLISATLFGSSALTKEENQLFRNAGVSHIVALSGFNITIIVAFIGAILFFLPFWLRLFVSVVVVSLYLSLVGLSGSILRAALMASISMLALVRGNIASPQKVLLFATLCLAFVFPSDFVYDASLQLSLLAMYGVLFVYPAFFKNYVKKRQGILRLLLDLFFITVSVTILVFPYTALVFQSAALYGIFSTLLITPFVPAITILGIVFLMIPPFIPFIPSILSFILFTLSFCVIAFSTFFAKLPLAMLDASVTPYFCFLYYSTILLALYILSKKKEILAREKKTVSTLSKDENVIEGTVYF